MNTITAHVLACKECLLTRELNLHDRLVLCKHAIKTLEEWSNKK